MATHKTPLSPLSINQLCEITGHTYRTIKKKLAKVDPEEQDGRTLYYNTIDALHVIFGADEGSDGKKIDGRYELARLNKLRADHLELDLKVKRGELTSAEELRRKYIGLVTTFRSRCLSLSRRLASEVRNAASEREAVAIIDEAMREVLSELSRYDEGADKGDREGSGAAAVDDRE